MHDLSGRLKSTISNCKNSNKFLQPTTFSFSAIFYAKNLRKSFPFTFYSGRFAPDNFKNFV